MAFASGMSESILMGYETTPGVIPGTFNVFKLPVMSPSFKPVITKTSSTALTGTPEPRPPVFGKRGGNFTFDLEGSKDSYGPPLKGFFGTPVDVGLTPTYDHYFSLGTMLSSTFEEQHSDIVQNFAHQGAYIGQWDLTVDPEGILKSTFGGMALSMINEGAATLVNGSITDLTGALPLNMVSATLKQGGVSILNVSQFAIKCNRGLGVVNHIDGTQNRGAIFSQIATVGGTMKISVSDKALLDLALNNTETSFQVDAYETGTGLGVSILIPTAVLEPSAPVAQGTGIVTADFNWSAYARGTASDVSAEEVGKYIGTATIAPTTLTLVVAGDAGADETITFTGAETTLATSVTKINATSIRFTASAEAGRLVLRSKTFGTASSIRVQAASTADVIFGLTKAVTYTGQAAKSIRVRLSNNRVTV